MDQVRRAGYYHQPDFTNRPLTRVVEALDWLDLCWNKNVGRRVRFSLPQADHRRCCARSGGRPIVDASADGFTSRAGRSLSARRDVDQQAMSLMRSPSILRASVQYPQAGAVRIRALRAVN
jgi:hypothetical protein